MISNESKFYQLEYLINKIQIQHSSPYRPLVGPFIAAPTKQSVHIYENPCPKGHSYHVVSEMFKI